MPPQWSVEEEEETTFFAAAPKVGVLQISAARKPNESVTDEDIAEFAYDSLTPREAIRPVSISQVSGLYAEYQQNNLYCREWWLKGKSALVFITCRVLPSLKESESSDIEDILSSLKIIA